MAWVRERNAASRAQLQAWPGFEATRTQLRAILDSRDRIPGVSRRGDFLYNFWQDAANPRGLLRRTTLAEYRKREPAWETVLDLDALAKAEGENWVWGGSDCLGPEYRRCIVSLSRGGADAKVLREFDVVDKAFVKDGFNVPEAKSSFDWIDADTAFHSAIYQASGNPLLIENSSLQWVHLRRVMGAVLQHSSGRSTIWDEHEAIVQAIHDGLQIPLALFVGVGVAVLRPGFLVVQDVAEQVACAANVEVVAGKLETGAQAVEIGQHLQPLVGGFCPFPGGGKCFPVPQSSRPPEYQSPRTWPKGSSG